MNEQKKEQRRRGPPFPKMLGERNAWCAWCRTLNGAKRHFHYRPIYGTLLKWNTFSASSKNPDVCVWRRCRREIHRSSRIYQCVSTSCITHTESHEIFDSFIFSFARTSRWFREIGNESQQSRTWHVHILLSFQIFSTHFFFFVFRVLSKYQFLIMLKHKLPRMEYGVYII